MPDSPIVVRQWIEFHLIYGKILTKTEIERMTDREVMRYYHQLQIVLKAQKDGK